MAKRVLKVLFAFVSLMIVVRDSEAATLYVPDQYKTIHEAVESALPGDTVLVREGHYDENILVTKVITIKSDKGPDSTMVKASNTAEPVFKVLDADGAAIVGFTATGSGVAGIYLQNADSGMILDNKTIENRKGIFLYSSNNNALTNNVASFNEGTGIYLELSNNNTLKKNIADSNKEKGIFLNASHSNKLLYNSASLNEWNGILFWSSNGNTVQGNKVLRNTYSIIMSNSSGNVLSDNSTWNNFNLILPIILIYIGILLFWIQRRIFKLFYREKDLQVNM